MVPKLKWNLLPFLPYLSNYKKKSILWPTILLCLSVPLTREESSPKVPFKTLLVRCCLIDSQPDFQGRFVTSSSILIFKMPMKVPKAALLAGRAGVSFWIFQFLFCKYFLPLYSNFCMFDYFITLCCLQIRFWIHSHVSGKETGHKEKYVRCWHEGGGSWDSWGDFQPPLMDQNPNHDQAAPKRQRGKTRRHVWWGKIYCK